MCKTANNPNGVGKSAKSHRTPTKILNPRNPALGTVETVAVFFQNKTAVVFVRRDPAVTV